MRRLISWSACAFILLAVELRGQPASNQTPLGAIETDGTLDLAFDAGNFTNGEVFGAALQADGKLVILGTFNKVHGVVRHSVARLNVDGTIDTSFDAGTVAQYGAKTPIVQDDGKIIIVYLGGGMVRLNEDGSRDSTFRIPQVLSYDGLDDGSGVATNPGYATSVVLQPDGGIVVVGNFFFVITGPGTNVARSCIARFNSDGSFDPSYDPGAGAVLGFDPPQTTIYNAVGQNIGSNAGKIIVEGYFDTFDGHAVSYFARLNADGSFDGTFDPGTAIEYYGVSGLLVQADDRITVFGGFTAFNGVSCSNIVRLDPSGAVDTSFSTAQFEEYNGFPGIAAVAQQPDGKLIVAGSFHSLGGIVANNVVRLETTGTRDAGFDATAGGPSASRIETVVVRPSDGQIFVGGYFSSYGGADRNNMAWVNSDGSTSNTFNGLTGAVDYYPQVYAIATQGDGKIIVGGFFSSLNGASHYNIVRLNPDSTIDSSFGPNVGTCGSVRSLFVQPDGKIVIGGNFIAVNGVSRGYVARLNSNGTLDTSFDPGTGAGDIVWAIQEDSVGDIYIGGAFQSFNGESRRRVAKLTSTGALDPIFQFTGTNATVYAITPPDSTGRIVIGGQFTSPARRIAGLDATTGAVDFGFMQLNSGFSQTVRSLALMPDGKYYAGGFFGSFNGQPRDSVARLNSDGSLDGTFIGPSPLSIGVYKVLPQNGKLVVAGDSFDSQDITRLTSTGPFDPTFNPGTGIAISPANSYSGGIPAVSTLALQEDGKLLIGGMFNKYNGVTRVCLARLARPPTGTPSAFGNISTRLRVETGDYVLIGGFIVTGTQPKRVIVRAIGPSLSSFFTGVLADPVLELRDSGGGLIASNDNWRSDQEAEIIATGIPPTNELESAIVATLPANVSAYTAIVRGVNSGTGIGVVEAYDLDRTVDSKLANISTRGFVQTEDSVLIGGLIVLGQNPLGVLVRALGPSLPVPGALGDPTLELHNGNGTLIVANDNWRSDQEAEITATGIPPSNDLDAAIMRYLGPGNYTAIVRGQNNTTGVAIVEAYGLN